MAQPVGFIQVVQEESKTDGSEKPEKNSKPGRACVPVVHWIVRPSEE